MERITIDIELQHVAAVKDGYTTTAEHYIAWMVSRSENEFNAALVSGLSERDAIQNLREEVAKRIAVAQGEDVRVWDVEVGRITLGSGYSDENVAERIGKDHDEAIRHNNEIEAGKVLEARQQVEQAHYADWGLAAKETYYLRYDDVVEVRGYSSYNHSRGKQETVYKTRKFKRSKKTGEFDWQKIRNAAEEVASYKTSQVAKMDAREVADKKARELRKAMGLSEYSSSLNVTLNGDVRLSIVIPADRLAEIHEALKNLGVTIS